MSESFERNILVLFLITLMVNFLISNKNLGFDDKIVTNKPRHSSINSFLSRILGIKSCSEPSKNDNLLNSNDIILRHFSLFF